MKSMTGFGRAEAEQNGHKVTVELKSVNHRFLDFNIRMPRFLMFLEDDVRTALKRRLLRGRVDVFVNYTVTETQYKGICVNQSLIGGYLRAAEEVCAQTGVPNDLTVSALLRLPDVVTFEDEPQDEELLRTVLLQAVEQAAGALNAARTAEGERIGRDVIDRVGLLEEITARIAAREPLVVEEYRARLRARLEEFLEDTEIDPNRFNAEILYFADKCSITEELVRLRSHFVQLRETLADHTTAIGRSLDFLVQELNRECNTIGSKSSDVEITRCVLDAKSEVEKIREQVQNIE